MPSTRIADASELRVFRRTHSGIYWSSKCPRYQAFMLGEYLVSLNRNGSVILCDFLETLGKRIKPSVVF